MFLSALRNGLNYSVDYGNDEAQAKHHDKCKPQVFYTTQFGLALRQPSILARFRVEKSWNNDPCRNLARVNNYHLFGGVVGRGLVKA